MTDIRALWQQAIEQHQAGAVVAAAGLYRQILSLEPRHHAAMNYLGAALASYGEMDEAVKCFERSVRMHDGSSDYWFNYGAALEMQDRLDQAAVCFERARGLNGRDPKSVVRLAKIEALRKAPERALALLQPLAETFPDDLGVLDALAIIRHQLGPASEVIEIGRRVMLIRDRIASERAITVRVIERPLPAPPSAETRDRNIVAVALWGSSPRYVEATIDNIRRAARHLPLWRFHVFCDRAVRADAVEAMRSLGAAIDWRDIGASRIAGLFWRFEPLEDAGFDRVLIRDADCRIGAKEAAAVQAWIDSGRRFHIMRDHPCYNELILAGMWGGVCGTLAGMAKAAESYKQPTLNRWSDQFFLRNEVWPRIKGEALIHDSHFDLFGARPFPPHTPHPDDPPFVGATFLEPRSSTATP